MAIDQHPSYFIGPYQACTTCCFQGYGNYYLTIPIVFQANQNLVWNRPFSTIP